MEYSLKQDTSQHEGHEHFTWLNMGGGRAHGIRHGKIYLTFVRNE